ncbi:hypothetical protein V5799_017629, partial [Amblyomma americanum]
MPAPPGVPRGNRMPREVLHDPAGAGVFHAMPDPTRELWNSASVNTGPDYLFGHIPARDNSGPAVMPAPPRAPVNKGWPSQVNLGTSPLFAQGATGAAVFDGSPDISRDLWNQALKNA